MIRYLELKSGHADDGPAWIARVVLSRSGRTVYFGDRALKRAAGGHLGGNHVDLQTGEAWWVSGVKRRGGDRWGGKAGVVRIEAGAVAAYLALVGADALDPARFEVVPDLPTPDPARFAGIEHARLG